LRQGAGEDKRGDAEEKARIKFVTLVQGLGHNSIREAKGKKSDAHAD